MSLSALAPLRVRLAEPDLFDAQVVAHLVVAPLGAWVANPNWPG